MKNSKILLIIIIASLLGFGIVPLKNSIKDLQITNNELLLKKNLKLAELKSFQESTKTNKGNIVDPEQAIPPTASQSSLLARIKILAFKSNVSIPESWNFSITRDNDLDISKIDTSFSITGEITKIRDFLKRLEDSSRFLGVKDLQIRTSREDITSSQMNVNLYAYFQEKINE